MWSHFVLDKCADRPWQFEYNRALPFTIMSLFEYALTRPIQLGRWVVLFWIVAVLYLFIITILNIISVGYDYVQVPSNTYNATQKMWYERLPFAESIVPASLICNPAQLSWNQGKISADLKS